MKGPDGVGWRKVDATRSLTVGMVSMCGVVLWVGRGWGGLLSNLLNHSMCVNSTVWGAMCFRIEASVFDWVISPSRRT